jgi:hypothetical protein
MQPPEVFRLLTRKIRRGGIMFRILWLVSLGCTGAALFVPGFRSWAVAGFLASMLFMLGWIHVRGRYLSALAVSEHPQLVYWAHPTRAKDNRVSDDAINDCKLFTLHLRDGTQFQAHLSAKDTSNFIAWLKEQNPSVRFGPYDDAGQTPVPS